MSTPSWIPRDKRQALLFALVLSFLLTVGLLAKASSGKDRHATDAPYLHLAAGYELVEQNERLVDRRYTGVVSARQHADVGFEMGGKLAKVMQDEGAVVPGCSLGGHGHRAARNRETAAQGANH